jgi:hypothetical protein
MLNKVLITLIGMVVAVLAMCNLNQKKTVENYLNYPLTVKRVVDVKYPNGCVQSTLNNFHTSGNGLGASQNTNLEFFKPTYPEKFTPPRFQSGLRGTLKQNVNEDFLAIPAHQPTQEDYIPTCSKNGSGQGIPVGTGPKVPPNYTAGNYKEAVGDAMETYTPVTNNDLNNQEMDIKTQGNNAEEVVAMNRFMFTTQRRGLGYRNGDPIRGDLPIVPCGPAWFRPSSDPARDLRQGALAVMGGITNDTHAELAALQTASLGGATYGGMGQGSDGVPTSARDINQLNMSNQATLSALKASRDIQGERPNLTALSDLGAPIDNNIALQDVTFSAF